MRNKKQAFKGGKQERKSAKELETRRRLAKQESGKENGGEKAEIRILQIRKVIRKTKQEIIKKKKEESGRKIQKTSMTL